MRFLAIFLIGLGSISAHAQSEGAGAELLDAIVRQFVKVKEEVPARSWGKLELVTGDRAEALYFNLRDRWHGQEKDISTKCSQPVKQVFQMNELGTNDCFDRGENFANESRTRYKCYHVTNEIVGPRKIDRFYRKNNDCGGDGIEPIR